MRYSEIFKEARRLHALGFSIHWLHARSKRPVESGWTSGPRKTWKYLAETYTADLNIGVRLGESSKIEDRGYLACIDLDVKDPEKKSEALAALAEVVGFTAFPEVRSGAGNGSKHLYFVSPQPFKMFNIGPARAKKDGWEIAVYSDGRQMVLPPSVHPETGRVYSWKRTVNQVGDLPQLDLSAHAKTAASSPKKAAVSSTETNTREDSVGDFTFTVKPVDLGWLDIPDDVKEALVEGAGVTDRSGYLMKAANALLTAGLDQDEILTVLTDPDTFIGKCGYEHAKTTDRARAARWVWRYTLAGVQRERDVSGIFGKASEAGEPKALSEDEKASQDEEMTDGIWRSEDHGFYRRGGKGGLTPDYKALLNRFEEEHAYKSVSDMKAVYVFNRTHYEDITPIEIKHFAERMLDPEPEDKVRNEFWNKVLVNNVARRKFFLDTTEGKINFKNGILDLGNGADLHPHSPDVGFRGVLPYEFDPRARAPLFEKWIDGVMLRDPDLVAILQEYMGYIVRGGEYKYHKALWLEGTGRNGKSTFIDVLKALIGAGNYSTLSIKSLVGDKFAGSDLDGKIANFSEETSPQELADSGPFKNLTGDGDMSAQKKFGDIYSFRNRAKLVMSYNTVPDLKDLSPGMMSRPLIVPFKKVIAEGEQDHDIKKKLFEELPGIFNFALAGWRRLESQNRFTASEKSKQALAKIEEESCNVFQWAENYVEFTEKSDREFTVGELYTAYRARERFTYSLIQFGRKLNRHPGLRDRHHHTRSGERYFGLIIK